MLSRPNGPALIQAAIIDEGATVVVRLFEDERWNYVSRVRVALPSRSLA